MMFSYKDKIEQLSSIIGSRSNPQEIFQVARSEHEARELRLEAEAKKKVLENLEQREETMRNEYDALLEIHNNGEHQILDDVEAAKKKSKILATYMEVFYTEEFPINKLRAENDMYCKKFWEKLSLFHSRAQRIAADLKDLKEMNNKYLELQQKIDERISHK